MGGGSKNKELSCCLARKKGETSWTRQRQERQRADNWDVTYFEIPGISASVWSFFFFKVRRGGGCTPALIHISNGWFLLMFLLSWISSRRSGKEREGRDRQRGERERERERATQRCRGSFAAEVKAEFLGSRKWDRLPPRSLSCVYVLWFCVFLQGRPPLHQHRSGLCTVCVKAFSLLLKHGLSSLKCTFFLNKKCCCYCCMPACLGKTLHSFTMLSVCVLCMCAGGTQVELNQGKISSKWR